MSEFHASLLRLMADTPGWLLLPVTFVIAIPFLKNQRQLTALWFTVGLHQCAAIVDCYLFLIPGGDADAEGFHRRAAGELSQISPMPYDTWLSFVYNSLGPSKLLGCELSILAYVFGALIFLRLVRWVGSERYAVPLLLLYGGLPGAVFHTSVTMREAYQQMALLLVVWMLAELDTEWGRLWGYVGLAAGLSMLFLLHNGLAVFALSVALVAVVRGARRNPVQTLLVLTAALGLLAVAPERHRSLAEQSSALHELSSGRLEAYMADYRDGLEASRASYQVRIDTHSVDGFLVTFPQVLGLYFLAPFPWQATGLKDLYALSESALRFGLLIGMVITFLRSDRQRRFKLLLLAFVFFSLESMWAAGTANWGQAIRHRVVGWGLFLLLGAEPLIRIFLREEKADS